MPHTLTHVRVQWVANPLSGHVYFVLFTRVDQVRVPALHRIELKTARFTIQRLRPLYQVVDVITTQTRANIARNSPPSRANCYSDAGRPRWLTNATAQKIKIDSEIGAEKKTSHSFVRCCAVHPLVSIFENEAQAPPFLSCSLRCMRTKYLFS